MGTKAKMLTAPELMQLHQNGDRTLPTKGAKEFKPTHSWLEGKQLQSALDERKALLVEQQVNKLGSLAKAEWHPDLKVANVTGRIGGQWKQMGQEVGGNLNLFPEEALFMLEENTLELLYQGVAMNVQQAYQILLSPDTGCTYDEYVTYSHLIRSGYIVRRHSNCMRATRYECKIRLDQHTLGQKKRKTNQGSPTDEIIIDDDDNVNSKSDINCIHSVSDRLQPTTKTQTVNDSKPVDDLIIINVPKRINSMKKEESSMSTIPAELQSSQSKKSHVNGIISSEKTNVKDESSERTLPTSSEESHPSSLKDSFPEKIIQKDHIEEITILDHVDKNLIAAGSNSECTLCKQSADQISKSSEEVSHKEQITEVASGSVQSSLVGSEENVISQRDAKEQSSSIAPKSTCTCNIIKNSSHKETSVSREDTVKSAPSVSEVPDIIIVDDNSMSLDGNEKEENLVGNKESGNQTCKQKQFTSIQNLAQECKKETISKSDVIDISDNSMNSQSDVNADLDLKSCNIQSRSSKVTCDDIEVISISDDKMDTDDIVAFNGGESTSYSNTTDKYRRRNFYPNHTNCIIKDDTQDQEKNKVLRTQNDWEDSDSIQNREHMMENRRKNRRKQVHTSLRHSEIEIKQIKPSIIDIDLSEDESKPTNTSRKSSSESEIVVVDLDDEDDCKHISRESWEEERIRILDSIPNIAGNYMIQVKIPEKSLLPPNICPQKEHYYVRRSESREAGRNRDTVHEGDRPMPWRSPWSEIPRFQYGGTANFGRGGNMTGATQFGGSVDWNNPPMNEVFQSNISATFGMQSLIQQQAVAMMQNFAFPPWGCNVAVPYYHHNRNTHHRNWMYSTRPRFHRPYYRRRQRYEPQYYRTTEGLGGQHYRNQRINANVIIPLTVEKDEKPQVSKVKDDDEDEDIEVEECEGELKTEVDECKTEVDDDDDVIGIEEEEEEDDEEDGDEEEVEEEEEEDEEEEEEDDDDVVECTSGSFSVKAEDDIIECTPVNHKLNVNGLGNSKVKKSRKRRRSCSDYESPQKLGNNILDHLKKYLKVEKKSGDKNNGKCLEKSNSARTQKDLQKLAPTETTIVTLDSSSEDEEQLDQHKEHISNTTSETVESHRKELRTNEPLVQPDDCQDIGTVLSKLQIIKQASFEKVICERGDTRLKISFDLYMSTPSFRKSSPGLPRFRIIVTGSNEPIPEPREVFALLKDFEDDVPLLFAIVLPDGVTFLQFGSIQHELPFE